SKIVTFYLVRNAAVAGDAITLVLDRQVDVARVDMIFSIDSQPQVGLAFYSQIVALQPEGIEPGKRYWLKSGCTCKRWRRLPLF
ncbi:sulfate adenylyltransferase subunit CysN, partial [Rhizobium johnstonii]